MGDPLFKSLPIIKKNRVEVFSSNYTLYASFSSRFASVVESLASSVEQYSIDELFFSAANLNNIMSLTDYGHQLRNEVLRQTTLMSGVGIAKTKTLAKMCNHAAKTWPIYGGVVALTEPSRIKKLMSILPSSDIWGVGERTSRKLEIIGIRTALDLALADTLYIRKNFGVTLERTVRELRGEPCFSIEEHPATKQQIVVSRSFGQRVTSLEDMKQAITGYAARAAERLRGERQYCRTVNVFIRTSPYAVNETQYFNQATERFTTPTQDSRDLITAAQLALAGIWKEGVRYAKAGVMLADFTGKQSQLNLFDERPVREGSEALMGLIDRINREGRNTIFFAGEGINTSFQMRRDMLSPSYTTDWAALPVANMK